MTTRIEKEMVAECNEERKLRNEIRTPMVVSRVSKNTIGKSGTG